MSDLTELTDLAEQFITERDWHQFHNHKDSALSLLLEAAEVLEHFQWKNGEEMEQYVREHKEELSDELSDVLFWVLTMSRNLDIDLPAAFRRKLLKNAAKYPVEKAKGKNKKYTEL